MKNILQINTSLFSEQGQSSQLARAFTQAWRLRSPEDTVVTRDLALDPVPHLTAETFRGFGLPADKRTPAQQQAAQLSDTLIEELRRADVIVLGLPMYNFGVPSTLKAYFDHVARAGVTFRYTASGPEGLLKGKKAYVLAARGGYYKDTPRDTQSAYVKNFLAFLGIGDVEIVYAEGLAIGAEQQATALAAARTDIDRIAA